MSIYVVPQWIKSLNNDELLFIKKFILVSGSLKDISSQYSISYPTARKRLDKIIQKVKVDDSDEEPYIAFIKQLAIDEKIDLESAKLLIDAYRNDKRG